MSVIYFTDKELGGIYSNLTDIMMRVDSIMGISADELMRFMVRVGLCNRLAYRYNYHQEDSKEIVLNIPDIEVLDNSNIPIKKLIERLELLEYNCVTNSGRCFLDNKDKKLFERLIDSVRFRYIELLEKKVRL